MVQIKRKLSIAVIAVAVLVLAAAGIGYAYWTTQVQLTGNQAASGHLSMVALDDGQTTLAPVNIQNIMPGETPVKKIVAVTSTSSKNVDLHFMIGQITGQGTLKDNLYCAFAFMTDAANCYQLMPDGSTVRRDTGTLDSVYIEAAAPLSAYAGKTWGGKDLITNAPLTGYVGLDAAHSLRHVVMWYYMPIDSTSDSQDSTAAFDMTFELMQSH